MRTKEKGRPSGPGIAAPGTAQGPRQLCLSTRLQVPRRSSQSRHGRAAVLPGATPEVLAGGRGKGKEQGGRTCPFLLQLSRKTHPADFPVVSWAGSRPVVTPNYREAWKIATFYVHVAAQTTVGFC